LSVAGLKARGWTDGAIRRFLGDADRTAPNPHARSAPPMRLYAVSRVEAVETSDTWRAQQPRRSQRKAAAAKAVQTKRAALRAYVNGVTILVPVLQVEDLTRRACDHFNDRQLDRDGWSSPASLTSDAVFLTRIAVNFLRHALSPYDAELDRVFRRIGVQEAYDALNEKVYAAISAIYPALAGECARQLRGKRAGRHEH
jgi:hypothetical protein